MSPSFIAFLLASRSKSWKAFSFGPCAGDCGGIHRHGPFEWIGVRVSLCCCWCQLILAPDLQTRLHDVPFPKLKKPHMLEFALVPFFWPFAINLPLICGCLLTFFKIQNMSQKVHTLESLDKNNVLAVKRELNALKQRLANCQRDKPQFGGQVSFGECSPNPHSVTRGRGYSSMEDPWFNPRHLYSKVLRWQLM